MWESIERFIDRVLAPVPAHLLIISGMLLLGMTVVMPAWMETRELGWQVALMKVQAQRLDEQEQSYRKFNDALAADDPVLLERLAYYHLHLKPAGSATLTASVANGSASQESPSIAAARAKASFARIPTVEELLHRSIPQAGVNIPAYQPIRTRLVALTTGPMRVGVIAAGLFCLLAGMTSPLVVMDEEEDDELPMTLPIEELAAAVSEVPAAPVVAPAAAVKRLAPSYQESRIESFRRQVIEARDMLRLRLSRWGA